MGGNLFHLLQLFGITPLKSTIIERRNKNCNTILAAGFDYSTTSKYDYIKKDFDNMHGVGGYNTTKEDSFGVTETTQQVNSIYTAKQATEDGLYYDPINPDRVSLDRTKLNWDDVRGEEGFQYDDIKNATTKEAIEPLAEVVIDKLEVILEELSEGNYFTYEEAKERLEHSFWDDTVDDISHMEYGNKAIQQCGDNSEFEGISTTRIEEDNNEQPLNHLSCNNAATDVGLDIDLKKKTSVTALIKYSNVTRRAILTKSEKKEDSAWVQAQTDNNIKPLLEDFTPALCGDGDPIITLNTLRRENKLYRSQIFGLGGFHVALTAWRAIGRCYGPGVSRNFFSLWRRSPKALDWVEDPGTYSILFVCISILALPIILTITYFHFFYSLFLYPIFVGDPNQVIRETSTLVLALYVSATRGYVRSVTDNDNNDRVDVSAANILDYMGERAKKERILLVLLQYLRLVHETELLYKAEKNADIELFLVALKHISLACCVSHSTGYVKLLSDFFVEWTCASPALKKLYGRAILFRKTVNGNNIFSDRLMEWIIRDCCHCCCCCCRCRCRCRCRFRCCCS